MTTGAALEVTDLSLRFGGVHAIDAFSLSVAPGELLGIIGPNGAGKSSLFNCLSGAYTPTTGTIKLDGEDITTARPHARAARGLARTFQNLVTFPELSVVDNLLLGAQVTLSGRFLRSGLLTPGIRTEERDLLRRAHDVAERLDLLKYFDGSVADMPYGVQKRLDIGRILLRRPRIALLDEPLVGMTTSEKQEMVHVIEDLRTELGLTVILVEHDVDVVMQMAERVVVLNFGALLTEGTPEEVRRDPRVIEAYLGGSPVEA